MNAPVLSPALLQVTLQQLVKYQGWLALYHPLPYTQSETVEVGDGSRKVINCVSPLQVREVMAREAENRCVIITKCTEEQLGLDVVVRLARQRLAVPSIWTSVEETFRVKTAHGLKAHPWIAQLLLEERHTKFSGNLNYDLAMKELLGRYLGWEFDRPDLMRLLNWSARPERLQRYPNLPEALREALPEWVRQSAGAPGVALLQLIERQQTHPIAFGYVLHLLGQPALASDPAALTALGQLRGYHRENLSAQDLGDWGKAAQYELTYHVPDPEDPDAFPLFQECEKLLVAVQASQHAHFSELLPLASQQRLERAARALDAALEGGSLQALVDAVSEVKRHRDWQQGQTLRLQTLEMAVRLVGYLRTAPRPVHQFAQALSAYAEEGGFVVWAQRLISAGDPLVALQAAYMRLAERVRVRLESEARGFASLLAEWSPSPRLEPPLLLIEDVLKQVVQPLSDNPVLVLVLDGMSMAVFRELLDSLYPAYSEWVPASGARFVGCAGFPTVTQVSRASLLSGQLGEGGQDFEKRGFKAVFGERARLFHKAELVGERQELAEGVRAVLEDRRVKLVGVVVNSADDFLDKGSQYNETWTVERIQPLAQVLDAARNGGRIVVLTTDHGHVLDEGHRQLRATGGGERWRPVDGALEPDEVLVRGPRVRSADGQVVMAVGGLRYGPKKYGYHGGASPHEVAVGIAVLAPVLHKLAPGWSHARVNRPSWWNFDLVEQPSAERVAQEAWIDALLQSESYQRQLKRCGRTALTEDDMRNLLQTLGARSGPMARQTFAMRLNQAPGRVSGFLAVAKRILNLDGYNVLYEEGDEVHLNKDLLCRQFELKP